MYAAAVCPVHLTTYICVPATVYQFFYQSQLTVEILVFVMDESGCLS